MSDENEASAEPISPLDAYKQIIDHLVQYTPSISGRLVLEEGIFGRGKAASEKGYNAFVERLSTEDRVLLSGMLNSERQGGIGDTLAMLSWWIDCREMTISVRNEPLPVDQSGMGLHGDYIGRLDGWDWPT